MTVQTRRTLAELRQAVRRRGPFTDNDTLLTYDVIDANINVALRQVSVEHDWPWLLDTQTITTAAGDADYDVETDYLGTKVISENSTDIILKNTNLRDILQYPDSTSGRPALYTVTAESVKLRPVPDGVYTLTHYFYRMEAALTGDTSQPLIPMAYDEGPVEYATYLCHRLKGDNDRSIASRNAYDKWLARNSDNLAESREPRAPRVRPGSGI